MLSEIKVFTFFQFKFNEIILSIKSSDDRNKFELEVFHVKRTNGYFFKDNMKMVDVIACCNHLETSSNDDLLAELVQYIKENKSD